MGAGTAYCVGCTVTVAILAGLVGINMLLRDAVNASEHRETSSYKVPVTCILEQVYLRISADDDGRCVYWRYALDVWDVATNTSWGRKTAYSNFYQGRCGGTMLNLTRVPAPQCWGRSPSDPSVRISAVVKRQLLTLYVGATLVSVSCLIVTVFIVYNVTLCCGACLNVGPFSEDRVREREWAARRELRHDDDADRQPIPETDRHETFDPNDAPIADEGWLASVAYNNAYARFVLSKFGSGKTAAAEGTAPSEMQTRDAPVCIAVQPAEPAGTPYGDDDGTHAMSRPTSFASAPADATSTGAAARAAVVVAAAPADASTRASDAEVGDLTTCCVCWERIERCAVLFPCVHVLCADCSTQVTSLRDRYSGLVACPLCRCKAFPSELRRLDLTMDQAVVANAVAVAQAQVHAAAE